MRYFNWYNQCPYLTQCNCFSCPAVKRQNDYLEQLSEDYSDLDMEGEDIREAAQDYNGSQNRSQADIERVIGIVLQRLANEINQIVGLGMNMNVIAYFIREMVDYLDKNYNKYTSATMVSDITAAAEDIKTKYYWIFNIMRIFGVPFPLQMRILYSTVRLAFENLRPGTTPVTPPITPPITQGQMSR